MKDSAPCPFRNSSAIPAARAATNPIAAPACSRRRWRVADRLYDPAAPIEQRVRRGIEFLFDNIAANPGLASLVLREAGCEGERADCVETRLIRPNLAFYRPLWEEAMRAGIFGQADVVVAHAALIGAISMLVSSRHSISRLAGEEMDVGRLREAFCRGVIGRGAGQAEPPPTSP